MLLADLPFSPSATEEDVALALQFFDDIEEKASSVGNWRTVFGNGRFEDWRGRGCHASLGTNCKGSKCVALAHPPYADPDPYASEDTSLYVRWLWEESFASRFVLARHKHGAVVSTDIPGTLLHNIAIMSRHARELSYQQFHKFFDYLYPLVGGDLAYVLAFNTGYIDFDNRLDSVMSNQGASHRAFPLFDVESLGMFLRRDFGLQLDLDKDKLFSSGNGGMYGGVKYCKTFVPGGWSTNSPTNNFALELYSKDSEFKGRIAEYRTSRGADKTYRPPNPFKAQPRSAPRGPSDFTFREVLDCVLPYMKEKGLIP